MGDDPHYDAIVALLALSCKEEDNIERFMQ